MIAHDLFGWVRVAGNGPHAANGTLVVRSSVPGALLISCLGVESLTSYGTEWDLSLDGEVEWRFLGDKSAAVFRHEPLVSTSSEFSGEVFTNADRMLQESEQVQEIRRVAREFGLQQIEMVREMRAERQLLEAARSGVISDAVPDALAGKADAASAVIEGEADA